MAGNHGVLVYYDDMKRKNEACCRSNVDDRRTFGFSEEVST